MKCLLEDKDVINRAKIQRLCFNELKSIFFKMETKPNSSKANRVQPIMTYNF